MHAIHQVAGQLAALYPQLEAESGDGGFALLLGAGRAPWEYCWRPPADVYETPDAYFVQVELAGARREQLRLLLLEDALVIDGQRPANHPASPGRVVHRAAIRYGSFLLAIRLQAPVAGESTVARYEDGFLHVMLPKRGAEEGVRP